MVVVATAFVTDVQTGAKDRLHSQPSKRFYVSSVDVAICALSRVKQTRRKVKVSVRDNKSARGRWLVKVVKILLL